MQPASSRHIGLKRNPAIALRQVHIEPPQTQRHISLKTWCHTRTFIGLSLATRSPEAFPGLFILSPFAYLYSNHHSPTSYRVPRHFFIRQFPLPYDVMKCLPPQHALVSTFRIHHSEQQYYLSTLTLYLRDNDGREISGSHGGEYED
jgi:hypothetical protein